MIPCRRRPLRKQIATTRTSRAPETISASHAFRFGAGVERVDAHHDQGHRRRGDHGGVDRAASLLGPVDVVEVDPERELVDRQAGADAEEEAADLRVGALAVGGEAERAGDHHRHDPEDQVVEVDAAVADHAARPPGHLGAAHQPRAHADEGEGEDEPDQDQEDALAIVGEDVFVPEVGDEGGVDHAVTGADLRRRSPIGISRRRPWRAIRSRVSSTAAIAKTGVKTMFEADSASPGRRRRSRRGRRGRGGRPARRTTSPSELDRGEDEEDQPEVVADEAGAAAQGAASTGRPSISTTGPARPNQTKTRMPGTKKTSRPTMTRAT